VRGVLLRVLASPDALLLPVAARAARQGVADVEAASARAAAAAEVARLDRALARGLDELLQVEPALAPALRARLAAVQQARAAAQVRAAAPAPAEAALALDPRALRARCRTLARVLARETAEPAGLRVAVGALVDRITVRAGTVEVVGQVAAAPPASATGDWPL
jgi:hypothetical protein